MKPKIFIGSSVEGLDVAYAIQEELDYYSEPTVWTQGVFNPSTITIDELNRILQNTEYAVFVFTPDDISIIREQKLKVVRDNIIFEIGLFIGKLGRKNVFFVIPKNEKDFHLPTDLIGITPGKYDNNRSDNNLNAALGPFCNQIRKQISKVPKQDRKLIKEVNFNSSFSWKLNHWRSNNCKIENQKLILSGETVENKHDEEGSHINFKDIFELGSEYEIECLVSSDMNSNCLFSFWCHDNAKGVKKGQKETSRFKTEFITPSASGEIIKEKFKAKFNKDLRIHLQYKAGKGRIIVEKVQIFKLI